MKENKNIVSTKEEIKEDIKEEFFEEYTTEDENEYIEKHAIRKHVYEDKRGNPFMRAVKMDTEPPFVVQRWEDEQWKKGTKGMQYIPYKLPELIEGVDTGQVIFIANGEKDVDTLQELGFVATTGPFDYDGKWKFKFNQYIKKSKVIVIKEKSDNASEFADTTLETISKCVTRARCLPIENICKALGVEANTYTDITEIREKLADDKRLIEFLNKATRAIKEGRC